MASKKSGNGDFDFAQFRELFKAQQPGKTVVDSKQQRRYFLVVSEGKRTEPIYFQHLSEQLPKHLMDTVEVNGVGQNTVSVVKQAMMFRDKRLANKELPPYDEVWAVYDKDDFPAKRYHEAITLAKSQGIESGHSNQSFELWYVLHFQYLQSALHRNDYISILTKILRRRYQKNNAKITEQICTQGNVEQAILWAKKLEELHPDPDDATACPYTRIYILVERLLAYIQDREPRY